MFILRHYSKMSCKPHFVNFCSTIADKSGSSSPMGSMPEDFAPLLSYYSYDDYKSDSMDELPEGQEEATVRLSSCSS